MVYFIRAVDSEFVKIGTAQDPDKRLRELQTGCPFALVVEGRLPGGVDAERMVHAKLDKHRFRGEWFVLSETDVQELLASGVPDPGPPPSKPGLHPQRGQVLYNHVYSYACLTMPELLASGSGLCKDWELRISAMSHSIIGGWDECVAAEVGRIGLLQQTYEDDLRKWTAQKEAYEVWVAHMENSP